MIAFFYASGKTQFFSKMRLKTDFTIVVSHNFHLLEMNYLVRINDIEVLTFEASKISNQSDFSQKSSSKGACPEEDEHFVNIFCSKHHNTLTKTFCIKFLE